MRRVVITACLVLCACAPELPALGSRISAPRVIAVRADPPEARPGTTVHWHALVATPSGPVSDAVVHWALCLAPRGPSDSITLASACLGDGLLADGGTILGPFMDDGHADAMATIPVDACQRVGPQVPPVTMGMQRQRPPDPDITGGYYVPIRLQLTDPPAADFAFARERLSCALADTPIDVAREFQMRYHANQHPTLAAVVFHDAAGDHALAPDDPSQPAAVAANGPVQLIASWPAESAESYVLVDPVTRRVAERIEQLEVTWFTNGGVFAHERTSADPGASTHSTNTLRLDAGHAGVVTVWAVLRDDRGGVAFASFALSTQ